MSFHNAYRVVFVNDSRISDHEVDLDAFKGEERIKEVFKRDGYKNPVLVEYFCTYSDEGLKEIQKKTGKELRYCTCHPDNVAVTSAEQVLKLSDDELFHLECIIEEELKGLAGQAKVRCGLCRAMLKKIKLLQGEKHHDEPL
jgi:hypothetical protein